MKKILLLLVLHSTFSILNSFSQAGLWTWIHGASSPYSGGNSGTQGVSSATNEPPALYEACEWTDLQGNFWLFGGTDGGSNTHGQLWKYNPANNQWTWMTGLTTLNDAGNYGAQGVSSPTNRPPARGFGYASWVDTSGNLWMFGGDKQAGGAFSDLWRYTISNNEWTWMKGPSATNQAGVYGTQGVPNAANNPGARWECAPAWTDNNNNLWLFGGIYNVMNDLWRYSIATNTWTWMKGSSLQSQPAVYGIRGVEDSLNTPGARITHCRWKDSNGNLWLFGGSTDISSNKVLNDLWRYNPVSNKWAWMGGDTIFNVTGTYGTMGVAAPTNQPGSRMENRAAWVDQQGNLWMFGGGLDFQSLQVMNDLWMYNISTGEWTWEAGNFTPNPGASYGTINITNPSNTPNGRSGALGWTDNNCHFFMFGGTLSVSGSLVPNNDLWRFDLDSNLAICSSLPHASFVSSDTVFCDESGRCINFFDHSTGNPTNWQWLFPGASPGSSLLQNPDSICYTVPGTYSVILIVTNNFGTDTLNAGSLIVLATPPLPPTITVLGGDTLVTAHASSYQWYKDGFPVSGATDSSYIATQSGTYSVRISDGNGCTVSSGGIFITSLNAITDNPGVKIFPNPSGDWFEISGLSSMIHSGRIKNEIELVISNVLGEKVYGDRPQLNSDSPLIVDVSNLAKGIYFLMIRNVNFNYVQKLVKE